MRCKPLAIISADATNCFDQISHPFASLVCQYFGLHISYIIVFLKTIQQMQMHVRTSFGISQGFYEGFAQKPFQGAIQGNGASTAIWIIVSIFLLMYMEKHHPTQPIFTPITLIPLFILAIMYIDDTDLFIFNTGSESEQEIAERAQKLLDTWHFALKLSGGDLKLEKSSWLLLLYQWIEGISQLSQNNSYNLYINVNNTPHAIKKCKHSQVTTIVGIDFDHMGALQQVTTSIKQKCINYITKLKAASLPSTDIRFGFLRYW